MKKVNITINATLLLEGYSNAREHVYLYETEDQFISVWDNRIWATENYDFDYRGLAESLSEDLEFIDYVDPSLVEIVDDWIYVGADCQALADGIKGYFCLPGRSHE